MKASALAALMLLGLLPAVSQAPGDTEGRTAPPRTAPSVTAPEVSIEEAIVKIYAVSNTPAYHTPWSASAPEFSHGSGCLIEGGFILTNAHVVSNQTFLQVRRSANPRRFQARLVAVSHDADLALLAVDDPAFFEGARTLAFGELPRTQDKVTIYGFPMGGDALSISQGVISRIEHNEYVHSGLSLLSGQVDAAINPGNSGGPVIVDSRIVGVAMQIIPGSQNIGYMVPTPVIAHFFRDIEDGRHDGFPYAGITDQSIENEAVSSRFAVGRPQAGVLVTATGHGTPASRALRVHDVIVGIDGIPVAGDGTIEFRPGNRTSYSYALQSRQVGETIALRVVRDGAETEVVLSLDLSSRHAGLVPPREYDLRPRYFIFGGIVFMPLSINLLEGYGQNWQQNAPPDLLNILAFANSKDTDRDEIIVIRSVLSAPVNVGYTEVAMTVIETLNGVRVRNLEHLVKLIEEDLAGAHFLELRTGRKNLVVLDRAQAARENGAILERYGIETDRRLRGED